MHIKVVGAPLTAAQVAFEEKWIERYRNLMERGDVNVLGDTFYGDDTVLDAQYDSAAPRTKSLGRQAIIARVAEIRRNFELNHSNARVMLFPEEGILDHVCDLHIKIRLTGETRACRLQTRFWKQIGVYQWKISRAEVDANADGFFERLIDVEMQMAEHDPLPLEDGVSPSPSGKSTASDGPNRRSSTDSSDARAHGVCTVADFAAQHQDIPTLHRPAPKDQHRLQQPHSGSGSRPDPSQPRQAGCK